MKPDLFIRADGSAYLGLGHLVRSSSLAYYLNNFSRITFVCRLITENFKKELQKDGIKVIEIDSDSDFLEMVNQDSFVVLDGYQFTDDYQKKIKQKGCKLVCIDDIHEGEYHCDMIINQAPGVSEELYDAQPYTTFALGPDYALLRPPFINRAGKTRSIDELKSVLICFGGSDYKNLTNRSTRIIQDFKQFEKIIIITGSAYEHEFEGDGTSDSRIEHYRDVSAGQMANFMSQSDVAIVPASGILFEALAVGCHVISGYYNKNQLQIYNGFKELGAFSDAGTFQPDDLIKALNTVKPGKTKTIIDGKSPERLAGLFKKLSQKEFGTI